MARLIALILIGVLMAGNASAKDIAKALVSPSGPPLSSSYKDPGGGKIAPNEGAITRDEYIKEILALPPLTPEQNESLRQDDAWKAGLKEGPSRQQGSSKKLPGLSDDPWRR